MPAFTSVATALALLSVTSALVVPANKPIQFNNAGYPTPSCLGVSVDASGNQAVVGNCDPGAGQQLTNPLSRSWVVAKGGASSGTGAASTIVVYGNQCLDVRDGKNADGNPVQTYTCNSGNQNQQWNVNADGTVTWAKDHSKCLDVDQRHGLTVINTCNKSNFQKWNANNVVPWMAAPIGKPFQLQINDHHERANDNTGSCMAVKGSFVNGAAVNVQPCNIPSVSRSWVAPKGGSNTGTGPSTTLTIAQNYCLDVTGGVDKDGTKLQIWTCGAGNKNQQFTINGDGSIRWVGGNNKCVDLTDGNEAGEAQLQIWTCGSNNYNQKWIPFYATA